MDVAKGVWSFFAGAKSSYESDEKHQLFIDLRLHQVADELGRGPQINGADGIISEIVPNATFPYFKSMR